jgi:sugar lactone lactonase YvrE
VALSADGELFIADTENNVIRKVDATGIITTFAGTGSSGYSGDGGSAASAKLKTAVYVEVDAAGVVYISDSSNQVIRQVDTAGIITTLVGTGAAGDSGLEAPLNTAQLAYPAGVTVDSAGSLYVADNGNRRVKAVLW